MTHLPPSAQCALSLRVGITGTRKIMPAQRDRISQAVDQILAEISAHVAEIARSPVARGVYRTGDTLPPMLRVVSPIAEGADRLLAFAALKQGFSLICPLPFARDDYESDFSSVESKQEYRALLEQAGPAVVEFDCVRGDAETRSYEAVGRYVARNCDILIAIWNGKPSRGLGGTTDVVRFAVHHGPPVWWIPAEQDVAPGWLIDDEDFRQSADWVPRTGGDLRSYLEYLILPPAFHAEKPATAFEYAAHLLEGRQMPTYASLAQPKRLSKSWIWRAHAWLIGTMAGNAPVATSSLTSPPSDPAATYWFDRYRPGDSLASDYAQRYRSSYVWTFALAALALITAAIALVVPSQAPVKLAVTGTELLCLMLIGTIILANERRSFHRHFLEFRLFAELCRKQQALALCGWSLPGPCVTGKSLIFASPGENPIYHSGDWVLWLFGVMQRAAPQVQGMFNPVRTAHAREQVMCHLIDDQLSYHQHRAAQSERANARLGQFAEWSFLTVLAIVIAKLVLIVLHADHDLILTLGLFAAILPALSAGFVGIRSYAELSPIADQSRRMEHELTSAKARIERLQTTQPLASQALGAEVFGVATAMLRDIEGWMQLFANKIVEPG